jgi:hypothetical protein
MKIPLNNATTFFENHDEYDFPSLWKPPKLFFPCKAANLWRSCLQVFEDPGRNTQLVDGPTESDPPASKEKVIALADGVAMRLDELHGDVEKDPLAYTIATLTGAVLDFGFGKINRKLSPNQYRKNPHNSWAQILAGLLVKLRQTIDEKEDWHAGPLAFYHILSAVREFQPGALKQGGDDLGFRIVADMFLQAETSNSVKGLPVASLNDSRVFEFSEARIAWKASTEPDPEPIVVSAPAQRSLNSLLPQDWQRPPPDVLIGMCGSSTSGKTSIYKSLFQFNSAHSNFFEGMVLTATDELETIMLQANMKGTDANNVTGYGTLSRTRQVILFADIKGGHFMEIRPTQPELGARLEARLGGAAKPRAEDKPQAQGAGGVVKIAKEADLLILTIAPDEVANESKLSKLTELLRHVITVCDRKYAMIAVAFTKADDYGLATPAGLHRVCFQKEFMRERNADDAWNVFKQQATIVASKSPEERLRDDLLNVVRSKLWNPLWDSKSRGGKELWSGPLGVYLLSPLPEDDAYIISATGGGSEARWHSLGVTTLFGDFFTHYKPPEQMRSVSEIVGGLLEGLGKTGKGAMAAVRKGWNAK